MKMHGLLFGGLFWGILISLIGISMILKYVVNIDIPLGRIFFGIILVLFGMKIIFGHSEKIHVKHPGRVNYYSGSRDYNIIFSSGTIDLTNYANGQKMPGEINVIFGNATVLVPDSLNLEVVSTTVFGQTILPERAYKGFGEDTFSVNNKATGELHRIETNAVFGNLVFEIVPSNPAQTTAKPDSTSEKDKDTF